MAGSYVCLKNLQHCESQFRQHMQARHGVALPAEETHPTTRALRRTLLGVMQDVQRTLGADPKLRTRDLNQVTLNRTREIMVREGMIASGSSASDGTDNTMIARGQDVYGHRTPVYNPVLPEATNGGPPQLPGPPAPWASGQVPPAALEGRQNVREKEVNGAYARAMAERGDPGASAAGGAVPPRQEQVKDDALSTEELEARLQSFMGLREREDAAAQLPPPSESKEAFVQDVNGLEVPALRPMQGLRDTPDLLAPPLGMQDPLAISREAMELADAYRSAAAAALDEPVVTRQDLLPPPVRARDTAIIERYIALNGFDRDYQAFPLRNRFDVTVGGAVDGRGLRDVYREVVWLEATRLVLPMEVLRPGSGAVAGGGAGGDAGGLVQKPHYSYDVSLSVPYVMLTLGDLDGGYDGTNDSLRRTFTVFVYDRSYKAPNGRGYVLMQPAQPSRRVFGTPLSSLRNLRVVLQRPSGALLNNAGDTYSVTGIRYEPQNPLFLQLIVKEFFDGNEFFIGDAVILRGLTVTPPTGGVSPIEFRAYRLLEAYIHRPEGHEVVALGTPNENGFYRSFNILAPGMLDQAAGKVIIDQVVLDVINEINSPTNPATISLPGRLLNMSMQSVIMLSLGTRAPLMPTTDTGMSAGGLEVLPEDRPKASA